MSSTITESSSSSKKRKHLDDAAKPKKKRKHVDEAAQVNNELESEDLNSVKKEKTKKTKKSPKEDVSDGEKATGMQEDSANITKKEKKKRRKKDLEDILPNEDAEQLSSVPPSLEDEEMLDAPVKDETKPQVVENQREEEVVQESEQLKSDAPTAFHSLRMSIYLPIPAIGLGNALKATIAVHVAPLLLTYFPPAGGIILSYQDAMLSARPQSGLSRPLIPPTNGYETATPMDETPSRVGDECGASWAWLTATFLVFRPAPGDKLDGWTNAKSEGFIGLVSYNYFQTSIARNRIPKGWTWDGPSRENDKQRRAPRKGKLNDDDGPTQETVSEAQATVVAREDDAIDGIAGSFIDENGEPVPEDLTFQVVDLEMIAAQERGQRFALQLEGTLLDETAEQELRDEERQKWDSRMLKGKARSRNAGTPVMSGGLPTHSRAASIASTT